MFDDFCVGKVAKSPIEFIFASIWNQNMQFFQKAYLEILV